jgi:hypothetical protein
MALLLCSVQKNVTNLLYGVAECFFFWDPWIYFLESCFSKNDFQSKLAFNLFKSWSGAGSAQIIGRIRNMCCSFLDRKIIQYTHKGSSRLTYNTYSKPNRHQFKFLCADYAGVNVSCFHMALESVHCKPDWSSLRTKTGLILIVLEWPGKMWWLNGCCGSVDGVAQ